jgi:CubicO group peptidase (beta-lactamase class C family)
MILKLILLAMGVIGFGTALTLAAWMAQAGPKTVMNMIRYPNRKIDGYAMFPSRTLSPGSKPYHFTEALVSDDIPAPNGASESLDALLEWNDSIALLVLKDDRLVLERYYHDHTRESLSLSFSISKSFMSALVGMAIQDGYLESVDQPVTDFVPELADKGFSAVSVRHLMTMTSGTSYLEKDNLTSQHTRLNYTTDLEKEILRFTMQAEPGQVWRYKSGDTALLGLMLSRALAPKTISEYTQEKLWQPLGMEHNGLWTLDREEDGLEKAWCGLAAAARDYLKLGRLYLHQGEWQGEQLLPEGWVEESTQPSFPGVQWQASVGQPGLWNYGYAWWLVDKQAGSYMARGRDGQFIYVDPSQNAVVLRLGWSEGQLSLEQWLEIFDTLARRDYERPN